MNGPYKVKHRGLLITFAVISFVVAFGLILSSVLSHAIVSPKPLTAEYTETADTVITEVTHSPSGSVRIFVYDEVELQCDDNAIIDFEAYNAAKVGDSVNIVADGLFRWDRIKSKYYSVVALQIEGKDVITLESTIAAEKKSATEGMITSIVGGIFFAALGAMFVVLICVRSSKVKKLNAAAAAERQNKAQSDK